MKKIAIWAIVGSAVLVAAAACWFFGSTRVFDSSNNPPISVGAPDSSAQPYMPQVNDTPLPFSEPSDCEKLYGLIDGDLKKANYCDTDDDCGAVMLDGGQIGFDCYYFVNKKTDKNDFIGRAGEYFKQCSGVIDKCAPSPIAECVRGKCVAPNTEIPADPAVKASVGSGESVLPPVVR